MLNESLKKRLNVCSEISFLRYTFPILTRPIFTIMIDFYSYDTEALNKQLIQPEVDEQLFINTFSDTNHQKITLGVQQLYIIGNIFLPYCI